MIFTIELPTIREIKPFKTNGGTVKVTVSSLVEGKEDSIIWLKIFNPTVFKTCKKNLGKEIEEISGQIQMTTVESAKAVLKSDPETPFSYKVYELIAKDIEE